MLAISLAILLVLGTGIYIGIEIGLKHHIKFLKELLLARGKNYPISEKDYFNFEQETKEIK